MSSLALRWPETTSDAPDHRRFVSLKGEFEAEALARDDIAAEALYAARLGLDYLVKIGGCEAKADVDYLQRLGVTSLVAPMIETGFAMEKYMGMLPAGRFEHVGVTIETVTAVERIEEILDAGTALTNVTIGRSDLTASFRGDGVDRPATMDKVRLVATAARRRGLEVTMGGGINVQTRALLLADRDLANLLDCVETRKVVVRTTDFVEDGVLEAAINLELALLERRCEPLERHHGKIGSRVAQIASRL